ncbi:MAG: protein kinase, partial [Myxococcales bacterium]|nr:protein kinase [Myxococcales bacterium]
MSSQAELEIIEGQGGDKLVGQVIDGRYEIERVLGEGGMGLVYKARHVVLGKPLAIKVLRPEVSKDSEIIARFRQEAQSASSIGNQHIIDISDFGVLADQSTYFVMEFLEGQDLTGAIESAGSLEPARCVHIARQLCQALGAAHEIGIVHRDLKPDNVQLITRGGDPDFVKVLDFGIAKVGGSTSKLTRAGQVFGTPHYMSPEQCAGSGVDARTDIYALGVMLYEMACGSVPFDADNLMGILTKHLYEEPTPPSQVKPSVPVDFEAVILRAMAKKVEERYQNMAELVADLDRLDAGQRPEATTSFLTRQAEAEAEPPAKRSSLPLILGLVTVLVLGGVGAVVALGGEDPRPPEPVASVEPAAEPEPEPEPAAEPEPEPEVAVEAEPVAMVRIVSEPEGAEIFRGNELLGNAPLDIPKPTGEERLELEIRRRGYQPRSFTISAATLSS